MKVAICGGRDEDLLIGREDALKKMLIEIGATEIVTGGCQGIDDQSEDVARREMGLVTTTFRPAWDAFGRAAGPLRNQQIAEYVDVLIAFPGGRGTHDMIHKMEKLGKKVIRLE